MIGGRREGGLRRLSTLLCRARPQGGAFDTERQERLRKPQVVSALVALTALLALPAFAAQLRIIPEPQQLARLKGSGFRIDSRTVIVINRDPDGRDLFTANQLRRKIWDATGRRLSIVEAGRRPRTANVIAIGDPSKNGALAAILRFWPQAAGKTAKSEGYVLAVGANSVVVSGFDQRGTFYGCQTLIQLIEGYGKATIPRLFCYDYPDLAWRGTMVRIRDHFDPEFTKELVSEVMARFKMNVIELHMSYGVIFPSHPELYYKLPKPQSDPTTLDEVKQAADWARQHFMEVIPAGVSWTHAWEWQTSGGLNRDLLESPTVGTLGETLCPRNPQARKLMHDLIKDQIRFFRPKYLNLGWDEIGEFGVCPYCKGTDRAELFAEYLTNDRDYLKARGITLLIWADVLREAAMGRDRWGVRRSLDMIPKDIIMQDWIYTGHHSDFPSLGLWKRLGFRSLGAPYGVYPPGIENIWSWALAAKRHDALGIVAFNKYRCGPKKSAFRPDNPHRAEMGCYPFIAEWGWTAGKPGFDPAPYDGVAVVERQVSPDKASEFTASRSGEVGRLRWVNPPEAKLEGVWICYRTDHFPKDPLDGTFLCDKPGRPSAAQEFTHVRLPTDRTVYYSAFAHDRVRRFSPAARAVLR